MNNEIINNGYQGKHFIFEFKKYVLLIIFVTNVRCWNSVV